MKPRTLIGVLVGLAGVAGAASVLLAGHKPQGSSPAPSGAAPTPGVPLTTDGRMVDVGLASSIPGVRPFDTGPVNYDYNRTGWDYAAIGVTR